MKKQSGRAVWNGSIKEGEGKLTTNSKVLDDAQYSYQTRFEEGKGTNPDELVATAHAGCYAMALSLILGQNDFTPDSIDTTVEVTVNPDELKLTKSHISVKAKVPNIEEDQFQDIAEKAKDGCTISKALNADISVEASLE